MNLLWILILEDRGTTCYPEVVPTKRLDSRARVRPANLDPDEFCSYTRDQPPVSSQFR